MDITRHCPFEFIRILTALVNESWAIPSMSDVSAQAVMEVYVVDATILVITFQLRVFVEFPSSIEVIQIVLSNR